MSAASTPPTWVTPGEEITTSSENITLGGGTYEHKGKVYASLVGRVSRKNNTIWVEASSSRKSLVPSIGSLVTGVITRVTPRMSKMDIMCVNGTALPEGASFSGMIRAQDVRATLVDSVEMYKCFRPGDIVVASVLSLGDKRSYQLSTARNTLGVVFARSVVGVAMVPTSWETMQCPKTNMVEYRKVAKLAATHDNDAAHDDDDAPPDDASSSTAKSMEIE